MKRLYTVLIALIITASYAGAQVVTERCWHLEKVQFLQHKQDFWRTHRLFSTSSRPMSGITGGFYNITEGQYGFGLGYKNTPFSDHYAGITTVFGWRFGNGLALGGGTGFMLYDFGLEDRESGWMIPVIGGARYFIGKQKNKFFLMFDGGFLLNFQDFSENARYFMNPGLGITIPLTSGTQLSFAAGLFTQYDYNFFGRIPDGGIRDSFINMRLGLVFGK
ncbi:MAG: hypothetical protein P1P83_12405 [Bacteroidales bacterium]|nr:hypothetical protein [Bacteroidales bacterium]MDT8374734.1 hypothetical protein [Bacteroidales bacterium]